MEVERWLDAVQEMLSNDATGLGKRENLQEELNNCKVSQPKKLTNQVFTVYFVAVPFTISICIIESELYLCECIFLLVTRST